MSSVRVQDLPPSPSICPGAPCSCPGHRALKAASLQRWLHSGHFVFWKEKLLWQGCFFFFSWMGFGISQDCPETTSLVWSCPQMNLFQHISTSLQLKAWLKNHTSNWILTAFYSPLLTQILQQLRFPLWSFNLPVTEIQSLSLMLLSRRSHPNHAGQLFSGGTILFRNLGFGNSNKHKSWSWISENQNHNKLHLSPSIFRETDKTQLKNSVLKSVVFGISTSFVCLSRWHCQLYLRGWTRLAGKRRVAALLYPQSRYLSLESGRPEE